MVSTRQHGYLTHGTGGVLAVLWRLLMGIAWNVIVLVLTFGIAAVPLGWVYGAVIPSIRGSHTSISTVDIIQPFVLWGAAISALLGCLFGLVWIVRHWTKEGTRDAFLTVSLGLVGIALYPGCSCYSACHGSFRRTQSRRELI